VPNLLTELKILEKIARTGLQGGAHKLTPSSILSGNRILTKP
jgi:hypothetical protein